MHFSHACGLMAAQALLAIFHTAEAVTIDAFDAGPFVDTDGLLGEPGTLFLPDGFVDQQDLPEASVVGGRRVLNGDMTGVFEIATSNGGRFAWQYDGVTPSFMASLAGDLRINYGDVGPSDPFNPHVPLDADFMVDGHDRFILEFSKSRPLPDATNPAGFDLLVTVNSDTDFGETLGVSVVPLQVSSDRYTLEVPFAGFLGGFGELDFTQVRGVSFAFFSEQGVPVGNAWEFELLEIKTGVPEPGAVTLLAAAAIALKLGPRTRRCGCRL